MCLPLMDFFYHFLTTATKQDMYLHFINISIIVSHIVILYHIMIFLVAIHNTIS